MVMVTFCALVKVLDTGVQYSPPVKVKRPDTSEKTAVPVVFMIAMVKPSAQRGLMA